MLDSDTAVRRYGLNAGLGCNLRLKEICSTSRNLQPLELGQNGDNSRPQHFWFGRTWFHREKVVHIGPPPSGVPPKNITWGTFGKTVITFRSVVCFGWNFYGRFSTRFQFFLQQQCRSEKSQKNLKKSWRTFLKKCVVCLFTAQPWHICERLRGSGRPYQGAC